MNNKRYKIKPLVWKGVITEEFDVTSAYTPFGSYRIEMLDEEDLHPFEFSYCFHEYYDEGREYCDSVEEGKIIAENDWLRRITMGLEEA